MTLKTLDSALALLSYFTVRQSTWGVRELAKHSGMHHAVVHRILATYAANGYLIQHPETSKYSLGLRLFQLGQVMRKTFTPEEMVRPVLEKLASQCGETVFLSWLDGYEGLCIGMVQSQHQLRFSIELGERFSLFAGAHAKAILAFQPESFREEVYLQHQDSFTSRQDLELLLDEVRHNGWAYTYEEAAMGVAGLAVPLWSPNHQTVVGSVSIAGPEQRIGESDRPQLISALLQASKSLEHVTGYANPHA